MKKSVYAIVLLAVVAMAFTACSTGGSATREESTDILPRPVSMPLSRGTFSGVWYSPQFEQMYLRQDGDMVTGFFTFKTGGTIEGTVEGNRLLFDWVQPGDKSVARREVSGKGFLMMVPKDDKPYLSGKWGYGEDHLKGGNWTASFNRDISENDPLTLQAWQEKNIPQD